MNNEKSKITYFIDFLTNLRVEDRMVFHGNYQISYSSFNLILIFLLIFMESPSFLPTNSLNY
jgi:hypothetical protein